MSAEPAASRARGLIPFAIAALVCLVLGALGGVWAAGLDSDEPPVRVRFTPPREEPADFRLRDQDGRLTSLRDARGKVLVLTFLYSSCSDLCPTQAGEIVAAVGEVGGGVEVYGVSVDPVGDTQKRVRDWLESFGLTGGPVKFLIGTRRELAPVWRRFGIAPIDATPREAQAAARAAERFRSAPPPGSPEAYAPPEGREAPDAAQEPYPAPEDLRFRGRPRHERGAVFEHSAYVMLIDKQGRQRVGFPFEQLNASLLARDMKTLLAESE